MKLIQDADSWMDMIKSRNDTTHTYNEETAEEIVGKINEVYYPLFKEFERNMEGLRTGKQEDLFNKDK
jgi:nucleotidyltransferase substrate binding protein (TIGR01987 family)